ncbi:MAG: excinuclease ABC subunit UvrA [Bdellovibrionales bacterium]
MRCIEIRKASQNNLKGIDVNIPLEAFTVICGLSGSGKSSLAFETLYAEGQRRYLENLSHYIKQYITQQKQPEVESIKNLPPALALEQKNNIRSARATVASLSGLSDHLRLVFEKLSEVFCPKHGIPLEAFSPSSATQYLLENFSNQRGYLVVPVRVKSLLKPKIFLQTLYKAGFSRIFLPKKASKKGPALGGDIKDCLSIKQLPKKDFYILIDRFAIDVKEKSRLIDSFNQAFQLHRFIPSESQAFEGRILFASLEGDQRWFSQNKRCPRCFFELNVPMTSALFNFNSPLGACSQCEGYGYNLKIDEKKVIPNPRLSIEEGVVKPLTMPSSYRWRKALKEYCIKNKIYKKAWCDLTLRQRKYLWEGEDKFLGIQDYFKYLERKRHKMHVRILLSRYRSPFLCQDCKGSRLRKEIDSIYLLKKNYQAYMNMNVGDMARFFDKNKFSKSQVNRCKEALEALKKILYYLNSVGLSYLSLNRAINTLSGGEFQRLNLSNRLGLGLSQVLYVLDEPTVGLHPRDTRRMIELLKELKKLGNTVVVVEHDEDVIESCDHVIEMGPESGHRGGQVLWNGPKKDFLKNGESNTVAYLQRKAPFLKTVSLVDKNSHKYRLLLKQATGHNLKKIDLFLPLNRFVVVTGVSGSGKSSLISETLYPALANKINGAGLKALKHESLQGSEFLKNVILMDQSEVGRTSRSSIVSYLKAYDVIRKVFSETALAKRQGFKTSHFSLNVEGGRCPSCKGLGYQEIDMVFMDPIRMVCEDCKGKKFQKEVLKIQYKEKNIFEVLNMTVQEAFHFFKMEASLLRAFSALKEVGLSYVTLGQNTASLSGGERQRIKLAKELLNSQQEKTLYILDEPTKGLHFKEIDFLLKVLNRLVDAGASVLVIEHNLEVIKEADYIIDIGPEAGQKGGQLVAEGSPSKFLKSKKSHTAFYLKDYLLKHS